MWRTRTVCNKLAPRWDETERFQFKWGARQEDELDTRSSSKEEVRPLETDAPGSPRIQEGIDTRFERVLEMVEKLCADVAQVKQQMHDLEQKQSEDVPPENANAFCGAS